MRYKILILITALLLTACNTGPVQNNNPNPPSTGWALLDSATGTTQNVAGGNGATVFVNPGDQYMVVFQANSSSGIKTITLSGAGSVICHNNQLPFNEANPFKYNIPPAVINLPLQPNQQAFTQASNPFLFVWSKIPPSPPNNPGINGPALAAFTQCGGQVPLLGTTTYTGQATTYSGISSAPAALNVTTCFKGVNPDFTCPQ
jgi:hypothetical protein